MTDVVLFHHAQGLTAGVHAFADHLRGAGHTVTVPDLYAGVTFDSLAAGVAHARDIGMDEIIARGAAAVAGVPDHVVYAGFSLGAMPAQKLAQTRPGALGAIIYHGGVPALDLRRPVAGPGAAATAPRRGGRVERGRGRAGPGGGRPGRDALRVPGLGAPDHRKQPG